MFMNKSGGQEVREHPLPWQAPRSLSYTEIAPDRNGVPSGAAFLKLPALCQKAFFSAQSQPLNIFAVGPEYDAQ